jgi:hypothetical protein
MIADCTWVMLLEQHARNIAAEFSTRGYALVDAMAKGITRNKERNMGALITITMRDIQGLDPASVDLESIHFALAELTSLRGGYVAADLEVPAWLTKKLREIKRNLKDRERDAKVWELKRLRVEEEELLPETEKLERARSKIKALEAELGSEVD